MAIVFIADRAVVIGGTVSIAAVIIGIAYGSAVIPVLLGESVGMGVKAKACLGESVGNCRKAPCYIAITANPALRRSSVRALLTHTAPTLGLTLKSLIWIRMGDFI